MKNVQPPAIHLSKADARRFILSHQGLLPNRPWQGAEGVLQFIQRVGCIQFDPVNVVERNPELVLHARVAGYTPALLEDLLYRRRALLDGIDKVQAIYRVEDWPAFHFRRQAARHHHQSRGDLEDAYLDTLLEIVRQRGPLSSLDLEKTGTMTSYWGTPVNIERFALERLVYMGDLIIHHRVGSRRYYDLAERILPPDGFAAPNPFPDFDAYMEWHVLRRIGGIGLATAAAADFWLGMADSKAATRAAVLRRLVEGGRLLTVEVEDVPGQTFYMRPADRQRFISQPAAAAQAAECIFLPPLDNLMWSHRLLRWLFDFDYVWEVYKPVTTRRYGPYTLPVLLGERFIGRTDLKFDRQTRTLQLNRFWWEEAVEPDGEIRSAVNRGLESLQQFLGAEKISGSL